MGGNAWKGIELDGDRGDEGVSVMGISAGMMMRREKRTTAVFVQVSYLGKLHSSRLHGSLGHELEVGNGPRKAGWAVLCPPQGEGCIETMNR